jgi:hypothetical protein
MEPETSLMNVYLSENERPLRRRNAHSFIQLIVLLGPIVVIDEFCLFIRRERMEAAMIRQGPSRLFHLDDLVDDGMCVYTVQVKFL